MTETKTYYLRSFPRKRLIIVGMLTLLFVLIGLIASRLFAYSSTLSIFSILLPIVILFTLELINERKKKYFISFGSDGISFFFDNMNGSKKYSEIEDIQIGDQIISIRTMTMPLLLDLRLAKSTKQAHEIREQFIKIKNRHGIS